MLPRFRRGSGNASAHPLVVKLTNEIHRRIVGYKSTASIATHNKSNAHFIVNSL
jgi:hypothetical protein